ncbi:hypothetical protein Tco_1436247 [Tanacetum coccineum]
MRKLSTTLNRLERSITGISHTPYYDPIVSTSSPTLTPFGDSDFLLEGVDVFLALEYVFLEGDNKLPVIIAKDLSVEEKAALIKVLKSHKRAIAWKLSDIKEGDDKLPVIIAKDLSVEEKAALIKVLKSHKRAIAWKLSDIKGINP